MPEYEYKCESCGFVHTIHDAVDGDMKTIFDKGESMHSGPEGGWCGYMKRVFSFHMAPVMQEHMNVTIGKPISDMKQFQRELRQAGDQLEERTGIPHDFQPCDLTDKDALGVDDTGLKATHDAMVKAGTKQPTGTTVFKMGD